MKRVFGWVLVFLGAWAGVWISNTTGYPVLGLGGTMLWAMVVHNQFGLVGNQPVKEGPKILFAIFGSAAIGLLVALLAGGSALVFLVATAVLFFAWVIYIYRPRR